MLRFAAGTLPPVGKLIKAGDIDGRVIRFARGVLGEQALAGLPEEVRAHMLANASTHVGQSIADGGFEPIAESQIRAIKAPTLVVTGANSPIMFRRLAELLASLIPSSRRLEIPSASHAMHLSNPGALNAGLLQFLAHAAQGDQ